MNYPYIRAWGKFQNLCPMSIELEVTQAVQDNAPHNAIGYEASDNKWLTIDDIKYPLVRAEITSLAKEIEYE